MMLCITPRVSALRHPVGYSWVFVFGGGVSLGSPKHDPISDQKMSFFITDSIQTKVGKVCPLFQTETAQNTLPSGRHIPIHLHRYIHVYVFYLYNE